MTRRVFVVALMAWRAPPPAHGCQDETPDFIAVTGKRRSRLGGPKLAAPSQQPANMPLIGILDDAPMWQAFLLLCASSSTSKGKNRLDYRYCEGGRRESSCVRPLRSGCSAGVL